MATGQVTVEATTESLMVRDDTGNTVFHLRVDSASNPPCLVIMACGQQYTINIKAKGANAA